MDGSTRINGANSAPALSIQEIQYVYNVPDKDLLGDWVPQVVLDDYCVIPQFDNSRNARSAPYGMRKATSGSLTKSLG